MHTQCNDEQRLVWALVAATVTGDEVGVNLLVRDFLEQSKEEPLDALAGVLGAAVSMLANSFMIHCDADEPGAIQSVRQFLTEKATS